MKKTILISGIKGFLGSHLAETLKSGYQLYGIGKENENLSRIAVFSSNEIEAIGIVPDFVIMCHAAVSSGQAIQSAALLFEVNVDLTAKLTQKFSSSKIIYVSSASVYEMTNETVTENSPVNPKTDYASSKLVGEDLVLSSGNAAVIRLSSLYGKGMKEVTIIPNYVNQALRNKRIEVWGDGQRKQNYIHVKDTCDCIKAAIENFDATKGKVLLCTNNKEYSNNDLAQIIANATDSEVVHINRDASVSVQYNNEATQKLLGWAPQTDFNEGITNYIQWKKEPF